VIPVYSFTSCAFYQCKVHNEAAGASGHPAFPTPSLGGKVIATPRTHSRRERSADARLDFVFAVLKIVSEIQSAQHSLTTLHKNAPVMPGLDPRLSGSLEV